MHTPSPDAELVPIDPDERGEATTISDGLHHAHLRKRSTTPPQHPSRSRRLVRFMDRSIYVVGIVGPLSTLPQIYTIYVEHNAAGISVITWIAYALGNLFWIAYGVLHRERPIITAYISWFLINSTVAIGALLFG